MSTSTFEARIKYTYTPGVLRTSDGPTIRDRLPDLADLSDLWSRWGGWEAVALVFIVSIVWGMVLYMAVQATP